MRGRRPVGGRDWTLVRDMPLRPPISPHPQITQQERALTLPSSPPAPPSSHLRSSCPTDWRPHRLQHQRRPPAQNLHIQRPPLPQLLPSGAPTPGTAALATPLGLRSLAAVPLPARLAADRVAVQLLVRPPDLLAPAASAAAAAAAAADRGHHHRRPRGPRRLRLRPAAA